jgi:hypothetical protein
MNNNSSYFLLEKSLHQNKVLIIKWQNASELFCWNQSQKKWISLINSDQENFNLVQNNLLTTLIFQDKELNWNLRFIGDSYWSEKQNAYIALLFPYGKTSWSFYQRKINLSDGNS